MLQEGHFYNIVPKDLDHPLTRLEDWLERGLADLLAVLLSDFPAFFEEGWKHPGLPSMPSSICAALKMGFRALRCADTLPREA